MGCGASASKGHHKGNHDFNKEQAPRGTGKVLAIREAFQAIDVDRTGSIDAAELDTILSKLEAGGQKLAEQEKQDLFEFIDVDKSGTIQLTEFVDWVLDTEDKEGKDEPLAQWAAHEGILDVHRAAMAGDADMVKQCLQSGANINVGDILDVTPLHFAARCGHEAAARALVEARADVHARTKDKGRVPLHAAADKGSLSITKLLLEAGTDLNVQDRFQRTPLHWACYKPTSEGVDIVKMLLNEGADIKAQTEAGRTPLHISARAGAGNVVEVLVAAKADVNIKNFEYKNTPLHGAAGSGSVKATQILLAAGSEVNAKAADDMTPLHWSVRGSKVETAQILLQAKADVNAMTDGHYTPYGMAEEWSSSDMLRLLESAGGRRC